MLRLLRRLRQWVHRDRLDRDLAEELEIHRSMTEERLRVQGLSPAEAAAASRRAFGNQTLAREDARDVWIGAWLDNLLQDLRYAIRSLRKHPGFTLIAVATLGPAIGLNATLATLGSSLLWQPWAVPDPAAVVLVVRTSATPPNQSGDRRDGYGTMEFSFADYRSLADAARLTTIFATNCGRDLRMEECEVQTEGPRLMSAFVSGNYFSVLRIAITLGRGFSAEDDDPNRPAAVAIISHELWLRRFNADPGVIGRDIRLDAIPFTIVGVATPEFTGPTLLARDVWIPMAAGALLRPGRGADVRVEIGGRLQEAATRDRAQAELDSIYRPIDGRPSRLHLVGTSSFSRPNDRREVYAGMSVLLLGVLLVLLLACANVGNLLLARMLARGREMAVRASLGASRSRIVRQLLTEGFVLSIAASLVGLWIASFLATFVFRSALGEAHHLAFPLRPDGLVLAYACGLAAVTCLAFGLAPALHASRIDLVAARTDRAAGGVPRLRSILLCTQIAVSVLLLCSAGLLVRGLQHARTADRGFHVEGLSAITVVPPASYEPARIGALGRAIVDATETLVGAGAIAAVAFGPQNNSLRIATENTRSGKRRQVRVIEISVNGFDTLGLSIHAGRAFRADDEHRDVVVVSETMAREQWPDGSALGSTLVVKRSTGVTEHLVVGIARDADVAVEARPGEPLPPVIYRPIGTGAALHGRRPGDPLWGLPQMIVRGDSSVAVQSLKSLTSTLDPQLTIRVTPMTERFERSLGESAFLASIAGVLGALALALAAVGVFGVFAFIVRQQAREIGIRIALGARSAQVVRGVLAFGIRPVLLGVVLGLTGAFAGAQLLRSSLFGLSPLDPWAYLSVLAVLASAAVAALGLPAWRATRVDPTIALKAE